MDALDALEQQAQQNENSADSAGETPPVPSPAGNDFIDNDKLPETYRLNVHTAKSLPAIEGLKSGYELVADLLPVNEHKALGQWVIRYKITEDDPTFGNYLAGTVSFKCAESAQKAAELVVGGIDKIPQIVQDAFFNAQKDVRADLVKVFKLSGGKFMLDLQEHIKTAADNGAKKLEQAATVLDKELTRKIEIRKDEGVELWVQKAMEAADLAVAKHKKLNFYFNTMGGVSIFILGSIFGVVLALHV
ncbi:hypothetical protein [Acidithiobacillus thiooxidans]|uniref:hypothetical protein n=1 Tax=Acidithiobacillus thiooxidans TaxID=930 RepID=UPI001C066996|nr:hypothetical protein [Acidithiobacillus thiooxidans]MBU2843548.1 hypothetical protein [Acidithiobacillus thiooxidans]